MMKLSWIAHYEDGDFRQFQDEKENDSCLIDRARLKVFTLMDETERVVFQFFTQPGDQFVFRRRNFLLPDGQVHYYIVGALNRSICFITPGGAVINLPCFDPDSRYFYPVEVLEQENVLVV